MRKDNTQNYQTSNTRVQHFSDFTDNIGAEKDELKKVGRSFNKNEDDFHNLPNLTKMKFNKTTRKMDNLSKDEINDRIAALTDGDKKTDHKFKIVDDEVNPNHKFQNVTDVKENKHIITFEAYTGGFGYNNNEMTQKNGVTEPNIEKDMDMMDDEDYSDEMPEDSYKDDYDGYYDEEGSEGNEKSYMFFENLKTISRQVQEMMEMDRHLIDEILNNGHDWAEDHMSSAKENVEQVYDFLKNEVK